MASLGSPPQEDRDGETGADPILFDPVSGRRIVDKAKAAACMHWVRLAIIACHLDVFHGQPRSWGSSTRLSAVFAIQGRVGRGGTRTRCVNQALFPCDPVPDPSLGFGRHGD